MFEQELPDELGENPYAFWERRETKSVTLKWFLAPRFQMAKLSRPLLLDQKNQAQRDV